MTGWRIGFAVGNPELVGGLLRAKTNIDSGPLLAVQNACPFILENADQFSGPIRTLYTERKNVLCASLDKYGFEYLKPEGTMFVWARVPGGKDSMAFTKELIENKGLVVTPGIGFGEHGEGFFRMALTVDTPFIEKAAALLA